MLTRSLAVLEGSSSIRVFEMETTFIDRFRSAADTNSAALFNFVTVQRWLGIRIEVLGAVVVLVSTILVISFNDKFRLDPGIVGLLIIWSANFTITLGFMMDFFGEAEAAITAIERVDAMSRLPMEKAMKTDKSLALPNSWPEKGLLEFDQVCLRYRPGLPLALNSLSFSIPPGKSCGVVGRTGAGKSSLTVALFRLVEIESGSIRLDGQDLGVLGLSDVRGRPNGLSIIPQDPFLAGSTLREVLNPFGYAKDADVLDALKAVRIARTEDSVGVLDDPVEEGGSNFSVGERQLLNLARALLSKPKVLILDEATASVDGETDAFIQKMLRTRFKETTLLTIAHRLHTIMDYELVLVMDAGRAVEFGSPSELLQKKGGTFAELVDATGPEGSKALRAMVQTDESLS
jgi:ABC-type multidrug transport system fused ATPase/permease subunit